MQPLGLYIRQLREDADYSLREFARQINISAPFLSDIELGRRYPSDEVLEKIARVLSVEIDELKKHDSRVPVKELKELIDQNPSYGFAFRKLAEKKITPEELLKLANKKTEENDE